MNRLSQYKTAICQHLINFFSISQEGATPTIKCTDTIVKIELKITFQDHDLAIFGYIISYCLTTI